ncbi:uncharacterized protein [Symphalangus syndactylus]|uniref:uncharacterized protein n=1 Tax=Symphalangus syndactylus TaxID=9590 RepID=UPI003007E001
MSKVPGTNGTWEYDGIKGTKSPVPVGPQHKIQHSSRGDLRGSGGAEMEPQRQQAASSRLIQSLHCSEEPKLTTAWIVLLRRDTSSREDSQPTLRDSGWSSASLQGGGAGTHRPLLSRLVSAPAWEPGPRLTFLSMSLGCVWSVCPWGCLWGHVAPLGCLVGFLFSPTSCLAFLHSEMRHLLLAFLWSLCPSLSSRLCGASPSVDLWPPVLLGLRFGSAE